LRDDDDASLVDCARRGDRRALDSLLDRHADRIHAVCRRIVVHPEDALDATQEAMIAIARGITRFDGRAAFSTWCYRIATNAALDELRRKRRRPVPAEADPGAVVARGSGPDDVVAARVDVDAALRAVPEDFRVAVVLRDLCDLDYAEIAAVLDVPVGTVRSRINRGRAILVERLGSPAAGNRTPASGRRNDDG
jgi:RNA polymerase sigma-70 factor (ECF subfamily)